MTYSEFRQVKLETLQKYLQKTTKLVGKELRAFARVKLLGKFLKNYKEKDAGRKITSPKPWKHF